MLPSASRMTSTDEFRLTVRRGVRVARPSLVIHARLGEGPPPRVGFVVSKAVGNAVTRNRTKRRLRHLVRDRLAELPERARIVVRALPAAAGSPDRLVADFDSAWRRSLVRMDR